MENPTIREQALANDEGTFAYGFDPQYEGIVLERHEQNDGLIQKFLSDPHFKEYVTAWARREAHRRIRAQHDDEAAG